MDVCRQPKLAIPKVETKVKLFVLSVAFICPYKQVIKQALPMKTIT